MRINKAYLLFSIFALTSFNVTAQISPGDLSKAHAALEGMSNCTKCHAVGNNVTREKCLECHKDIKANIAARKGYHASAEVNGKECATCHNEHHGREFQLIRFNKKLFNHTSTGFGLKGVHAQRECNACHKPAFIKNPALKKKSSTYLGLNQECLSCHDDYHQGRMSSKCSNCHGFDTFKKSIGFDHNTTRFPLLGKHKSVNCENCHHIQVINGKKFQNFSGLSFANCTACHKDVHNNKFGQNCKQCHTEESFHLIKGMKTFDHNKTNFKLLGAHMLVDCRQCHKGSLTAPLKHSQCKDCHADYHKAEFAVKGISPDCSKCHNNNGFTPSTFTIGQHNEKFSLEGAHLATSCTECHKKQGKWTFRNIGKRCVDCHQNEHKGFISEKFFPKEECTTCHTTSAWSKVKFDHNKTAFTLDGKHATTACANCHYGRNEKGLRTQQFIGLSHDCSNCHKDSHAGQFAVNGKTDCKRCHSTEAWENSRFDHNTSRFKLDGAHKNVSCDRCHKPVMNEKGKYVEYKFQSIQCSRCHS